MNLRTRYCMRWDMTCGGGEEAAVGSLIRLRTFNHRYPQQPLPVRQRGNRILLHEFGVSICLSPRWGLFVCFLPRACALGCILVQTGHIIYRADRGDTLQIGPFTKACKKGDALGSERSDGEEEAVPGGLRVRGVDDDGPVPGVRDHAADRLCGVAALRG